MMASSDNPFPGLVTSKIPYPDFQAHAIPAFPHAIAHAAVCRDDLLFKIKVDGSVCNNAI